jgi:anti-sigma factor RsiW
VSVMKFQDAATLSAYLDGQLSTVEIARLEARLAADSGLRQVLNDLRVARGLLGQTPRRRVPRNFMLNAIDPRVRAPQPRAVPALAYAGVLASLLFVLSIAVNTVTPAARATYMAAPAYGMGGGMAGGDGSALPPVEAPEQSFEALPAGTPALEAPVAPPGAVAPTVEPLAKAAQPQPATAPEPQQEAPAPIPALWLRLFAIAAVLLGILSWCLDRLTRRRFHGKSPGK